MYFKLGYMMVNYLDDFGGAETKEKGWKAYETLGELLMSCGLEELVDKTVTSEGNAERNQFRRRLINIRPGLTQPAIKCNFPKRD
jgi:hypothetical protein